MKDDLRLLVIIHSRKFRMSFAKLILSFITYSFTK